MARGPKVALEPEMCGPPSILAIYSKVARGGSLSGPGTLKVARGGSWGGPGTLKVARGGSWEHFSSFDIQNIFHFLSTTPPPVDRKFWK